MPWVTENDPSSEPQREVKRDVYDVILCYKEMLRDKELQARQSTLDAFFKKRADIHLENEPQPVSSSSMKNHYTLFVFYEEF
jgi:hypothetical protein